jgi:hypothetical protein
MNSGNCLSDSGDTTRQPEAEARAERRRLRSRVNQLMRAEASVMLSVDALSTTDRLVVLNTCLRNALDDAGRLSR